MVASQQQFRLLLKPYIEKRIKSFALDYPNRQRFFSERGLLAPMPPIEWLKSFGNEEDWKEYQLSTQAQVVKWFTFGLVTDESVPQIQNTKISRRETEFFRTDQQHATQKKACYLRDIRLHYEKEKTFMLKGYCDAIDPTNKKARRVMCQKIMTEELRDLGFTKSKDLSAFYWLTYTKPINDHWEMAFRVEKILLNKPYETGFTLKVDFGIAHKDSHLKGRIDQDHPYMLFENALFYPMLLFTSFLVYEEGELISDLELFLLVQIEMYKNIHVELEERLISILKAAELF